MDDPVHTEGGVRFLAQDYALAVCSPSYLEKLAGELCEENASAVTAINALNWPGTWDRWLIRAFNAKVPLGDEINLQTTSLCVKAAQGGVGVAMAHGPLVQRELAEGSLVLANDTLLPVKEHYVAVSHRSAPDKIFDAVSSWVTANMQPKADFRD